MPRRIKYNDASQTLRFEFPDHWLTATGVNIQIVDKSGDDLLAATAATIYAATTTNGAVSAGDSTFVIDGAVAMSPGDRYRLSKTGETSEVVEVLSFASGTKTATIKHAFDWAHADESAVSAMYCTYSLDTSTTATWGEGLECTIKWIPNTDDLPFTEEAIVYALSGADVPGWQEYFRERYPNMYAQARVRLETLYKDARDELAWYIRSMGHDLNHLRDPEFLRMPIAAIMAGYVARGSGEAGTDEVAQAQKDFERYLDILSRPAIWFDTDQDLVEDEGEMVVTEWSPMGPGRFGRW